MNDLYKMTDEEMRTLCRNTIEMFEIWARRLIHNKLTEKYGTNYLEIQDATGQYLIKKEIRKRDELRKNNNERYLRFVDTLLIDHICYFLCHGIFYKELFKDVLQSTYPLGAEELRNKFDTIVAVRNNLSHANPVSVRQAEKVLCYIHDFIDGLKDYYQKRGQEKVWNVPRIIRVKDSIGNCFENPTDKSIMQSIFTVTHEFHSGDEYAVEIEVDPTFTTEDYNIKWEFGRHNLVNEKGHRLKVTFNLSDVSELCVLSCTIISKKEWHRYTHYDCRISLHFTVLPPIE